MNLNYVDLVLGILLFYGLFKGFRKGLIFEVCTLLALALGIWGGIHFSDYVADYLIERFNTDTELMPVLSFGIVFIAIVILVHLLGKLLEKVINLTALGVVNRILGALLGMAKVGLVISVLLLIVNRLSPKGHVLDRNEMDSSLLYGYIAPFAPSVIPYFTETSWWDDLRKKANDVADDWLPDEE